MRNESMTRHLFRSGHFLDLTTIQMSVGIRLQALQLPEASSYRTFSLATKW